MFRTIRSAFALLLLMSLLTGLAYPLLITGIAQVIFPRQASGSLVTVDGKAIGSALIGQNFTGERYFWGRPSATAPVAYNGAAGSGANAGPTSPALRDAVVQRLEALKKAHPDQAASVPIDLVTASASGLDPHISPAAAMYQTSRVARARGWSQQDVRMLVEAHIEERTLGVLGERRVNVLLLNLALDARGRG